MGRDKLSLTVGGVPLIQRAYNALAAICDEVLIVTPEGSPRDYGISALPVADIRPGRKGPLAGLEAGLAASRNDYVFVTAGDAPFVSRELAVFLLGCLSENGVRVAVPRYGGRLHPLCAAYERSVLADLSFALNLGVSAVRDFLENIEGVYEVGDELRRFGDPEVFLTNVNSPEDLEQARSRFPRYSDAEQ